jgi:hypothetical protein
MQLGLLEALDLRYTKIRPGRPLSSYSKIRFAYSLLVRNRRRQLRDFQSDLLNLGCGPYMVPGFINLDYEWRPGLDLCWDATTGLPFPDGSMSGVYTEHMLEHLTLEQGRTVAREMRRVLRP